MSKRYSFKSPDKSATDKIINPDMTDLERRRFLHDSILRLVLAVWVIAVDTLWLCFTKDVFYAVGRGELQYGDTVLCTLLGTSTATVIGLGYILLKGLFPKGQSSTTD